MPSLRQQMLILTIGALILLAASFIIVLGWHMKERAVSAAIIKAQTDLATCMEIINLTYPGFWKIQDGFLYKGETMITQDLKLVDRLSELTGNSVTIFLNDTRVATTVRQTDGERAIGTKVSDVVAQTVLKNGERYLGEANVVGQVYQTAYEPIRDRAGNIVGMFYVGISRSYAQEMIANSLIQTAVIGIGLTIIVGLLALFFVQRVIVRPLREITLGTRDLATGHVTEKVEVSGPKEIGELASAFNQMIERLENVAGEISRVSVLSQNSLKNGKEKMSTDALRELERLGVIKFEPATGEKMSPAEYEPLTPLEDTECDGEGGLPKGLNRATLRQIATFLQIAEGMLSAEGVAEKVKLTRVTVRRYLEFMEQCGALKSELKYGTVGRPMKLFYWIEPFRIR